MKDLMGIEIKNNNLQKQFKLFSMYNNKTSHGLLKHEAK